MANSIPAGSTNRIGRGRIAAAAMLMLWISDASSDAFAAISPVRYAGSGAPTDAVKDGSEYEDIATGDKYRRVGSAWVNLGAGGAGGAIAADPGDAAAIPVTASASFPFTTGGSGETNTIAAPTFAGQRITLTLDVDGGGNRVVTSAVRINKSGNTAITFADAGDYIALEAVQVASALVWQVAATDGPVLS